MSTPGLPARRRKGRKAWGLQYLPGVLSSWLLQPPSEFGDLSSASATINRLNRLTVVVLRARPRDSGSGRGCSFVNKGLKSRAGPTP